MRDLIQAIAGAVVIAIVFFATAILTTILVFAWLSWALGWL